MSELCVLVVEDDPIIRLSTVSGFQDAGFQVEEAATADEAVFILQGENGRFDVVFTDIETPGVATRITLAKMIAQTWPKLSVYLTSGRVTLQLDGEPLAAQFIPKPYDISGVCTLLETRHGAGGCRSGENGARRRREPTR